MLNLTVGDIINDKYKIIAPLSSGATGAVFLVENIRANNIRLALKFLHKDLSKNEKAIGRFQREMHLSSNLHHDNIIKFYELDYFTGQADDERIYYIPMEYCDGDSLRNIIAEELQEKKLNLDKILYLLYYLASAVSYLHSKNIVHRDLKPENVLISKDGTLKLIDLGISKSMVEESNLTGADEITGSMAYAAPEQVIGDNSLVDYRSDIYSFGIIVYEMLTGQHPFAGTPLPAMGRRQIKDDIPLPSKNSNYKLKWVDELVSKATKKDPAVRFQSMGSIVFLLYDKLTERGIRVRKPDLNVDQIITASNKFKIGLLKRAGSYVEDKFQIKADKIVNSFLVILIAFMHVLLFTPVAGSKYFGFFESAVNLTVLDVFFKIRNNISPPKIPEDVLVVSLDDESFSYFNASTKDILPRDILAEGIEKIGKGNPQKIILDLQLSDHLDDEGDQKLKKAIENNNVYIAKYSPISSERKINLLPSEFFQKNSKFIFESALAKDRADSRVRTFYYELDRENKKFIPPLSKVLYTEKDLTSSLPYPGDFINYYGPKDTLHALSFHQLFKQDEKLSEKINNKIVFIGINRFIPNSKTALDRHLTPFSGDTSGVEIHATIMGNLKNSEWIKRIPKKVEIYLLPSLMALLLFSFLDLSKQKFKLIMSLVFGLWVSISYLMFLKGIYLPSLSVPLVLLIGMFSLRARSYKEKMRDSFWELGD